MTRRDLDRTIERLEDKLLSLGSMVRQATLDAVEALRTGAIEDAHRIYNHDIDLNRQRLAIEMEALTTIATQQPLASDLRVLSSIIEVASELERMGDYAKGIARICLMIKGQPLQEPMHLLPRMTELAVGMLDQSLQAFVKRDAKAASAIPRDDDDVDQLFNEIYYALVDKMIAAPSFIDQANHLQWAAHNIERMADRVTNICERTLFVATGEIEELDYSDDEWNEHPSRGEKS
jgi:phosphate transport system protein